MSFNTAADAFWKWVTIFLVLGFFGLLVRWGASMSTPDLPFDAWLRSASRDDVWFYGWSMIASGVMAGRFCTQRST